MTEGCEANGSASASAPSGGLILVMTVNPGFGGQRLIPAMLEKIRRVRDLIDERAIEIEVDGGINEETAGLAVAEGADVLVAGSAVFGADEYAAAIARLRVWNSQFSSRSHARA